MFWKTGRSGKIYFMYEKCKTILERENQVIYKTTWLSLTKTMGFVHSFIQQVFVKHIIACARHCGDSNKQDKVPALLGLGF